MAMQPQRQNDDEPPLAPVIPLFRPTVDLDDEDSFDNADDLILRFVDELADGPGAS